MKVEVNNGRQNSCRQMMVGQMICRTDKGSIDDGRTDYGRTNATVAAVRDVMKEYKCK